jgi:4'-phosphopantetheinyl transferase
MPPTAALPLHPDEVHLWFAFPDELRDPALLAAYAELMSDEERDRHNRFLFARHRHEFLVARALVRATLSAYAPAVAPRQWSFVANEHGRPAIASPAGTALRFNLSHTEGLMLLGVVRGRDVGVDVEDGERRVSCLAIADRFFSPAELRDLHRLPAAGQRRRFFHYWTLKESYIKARGKGLAIPLHQFSFAVRPGEPLGIAIDPAQRDDPARWRFALLRPTPRHTAALAVRRRPGDAEGAPVEVVVRRTTPLSSSQPLAVSLLASSERALAE